MQAFEEKDELARIFQRMRRITPNGIIYLMKSFYTSYYRFYRPEQKEKKILAISDIHFNDYVTDSLKAILRRAEKDEPDLIIITGDLVDEQDSLDTTAERARFKTWLEHLGAVAPVCICLGNHDFFRLNEAHCRYYQEPSILPEELSNIPNVFLLDDGEFENENHFVFGLTLPPIYYGENANKCHENLDILKERLDSVKDRFAKLPAKKTKIFITHSPLFLTDPSIQEILKPFDFILAGHMHNGVVPPILQDFWRKKRGIFTPSKEFFKDQNSRIGLYGDKLITLGAVTTIQPKTKILGPASGLFPIYLAVISVAHNPADERKPDIKRKYEKIS